MILRGFAARRARAGKDGEMDVGGHGALGDLAVHAGGLEAAEFAEVFEIAGLGFDEVAFEAVPLGFDIGVDEGVFAGLGGEVTESALQDLDALDVETVIAE